MLQSGDGLTVRAVTPVEAPATVAAIGDTRGDLYQRALQKILGQQLQGEVMSRFTDGSFMVKVGDTSARMMLPAGTKTGDQLPMTLVSINPRPSFVIGNDAGEAAIVALSRGTQEEGDTRVSPGLAADIAEQQESEELQRAPTQPNQQAQSQAGAANLGANGRLARQFAQIGAMYRPEYEIAVPQQEDSAPIITKDGALIAHLEHGDLAAPNQHGHAPTSFSNAGKLINQLLLAAQREGKPQSLLGKEAIVADPANPPQQVAVALQDTINNSGLFYESHVAQWADGKRSLAELMREPQMQGADNQAKPEQNRIEFAQLVNLQLNTLEHQSAHWRGEIWPGQQMDWDVRKEPDAKGQNGGEQLESWQSVVRFHLPELGMVQASIHLLGERVHIQVQTADENTASLLRAHADSLAEALGAAGSPLDSLNVARAVQYE